MNNKKSENKTQKVIMNYKEAVDLIWKYKISDKLNSKEATNKLKFYLSPSDWDKLMKDENVPTEKFSNEEEEQNFVCWLIRILMHFNEIPAVFIEKYKKFISDPIIRDAVFHRCGDQLEILKLFSDKELEDLPIFQLVNLDIPEDTEDETLKKLNDTKTYINFISKTGDDPRFKDVQNYQTIKVKELL